MEIKKKKNGNKNNTEKNNGGDGRWNEGEGEEGKETRLWNEMKKKKLRQEKKGKK